MKKTIRFGAAGVAMFAALGMGSAAHAQDNADATASAEVLQALTLTLTTGSSVDFGAMVVSGSGSVTLDPSTGNLDCSATDIVCSGTNDIADFTVSGTASKAVTINLPTSSVFLLHTDYATTTASDPDNSHRIEMSAVTTDASDNAAGDPEVTLDASGDSSFSVGGTIDFGGTEEAGSYSATFNVSVEYT